jgi:serine O-acetyltransferase
MPSEPASGSLEAKRSLFGRRSRPKAGGGILSPARLWLLSISLRKRGLVRLAFQVKRLNALLYHNSLPINAEIEPDLMFEHHAFGVMVHDNVTIGKRVRIWHHVTLSVRQFAGRPGGRLIIEDDVKIGAGAIVITPMSETMTIHRGARIGAGAIVTEDVPPGATVLSPPSRVLMHRASTRLEQSQREADEGARGSDTSPEVLSSEASGVETGP